MTDPFTTLAVSTASLAGLGMVTSAGLIGWRGWLQLKRVELERAGGGGDPAQLGPAAGQRIEMADLRERVRKLEAIAAGVEL
jgi:hypothetical protein